jgi:hypothetical protein
MKVRRRASTFQNQSDASLSSNLCNWIGGKGCCKECPKLDKKQYSTDKKKIGPRPRKAVLNPEPCQEKGYLSWSQPRNLGLLPLAQCVHHVCIAYLFHFASPTQFTFAPLSHPQSITQVHIANPTQFHIPTHPFHIPNPTTFAPAFTSPTLLRLRPLSHPQPYPFLHPLSHANPTHFHMPPLPCQFVCLVVFVSSSVDCFCGCTPLALVPQRHSAVGFTRRTCGARCTGVARAEPDKHAWYPPHASPWQPRGYPAMVCQSRMST